MTNELISMSVGKTTKHLNRKNIFKAGPAVSARHRRANDVQENYACWFGKQFYINKIKLFLNNISFKINFIFEYNWKKYFFVKEIISTQIYFIIFV